MTLPMRTACFALLLLAATAQAQYPEKPIRFLVGFSAGSLTDLSARTLSGVASKYLKQQIVVTNLPGAAGALAMGELARSPQDGLSVALMTSSYKSLVVHQQKPAFDVNDLKTLMGYAEFRQLLFSKSDAPYSTIEELIAYGKKNPGVIKFGHSGVGTSIHLQGLHFFRAAGVDATDVPFKGSGDYINAVLGGHLPTAIVDVAGVLAHARAGSVRPLLTFTDRRPAELPNLPTAREKGFPGLDVFSPQVLVMIRQGTPADRARILHDGFKRATEDPDFLKGFQEIGIKAGYIPPEIADENIAKASAAAIPVLKELNLLAR